MTSITPIKEEELHAYLDGELPDARRAAVEAYLREHPDDARRLEAYRADGEAIARIFSHADAATHGRRSPSASSWRSISAIPWRRAAAAVLILAVGAVAGWFGRERINDAGMERLAHQAAAAHLILNGPGVEPLATSSLDELSRVMSSTLGIRVQLRDPSSTGYKIVGARIVPQGEGRAVQLVVRGPADETIAFYLEGRPGAKETPFRRMAGEGLTTLVWEDDDLACAITSTLEPKKLEEVSRRIYDALLG
jgi:anti-sigma factor RsiW